MHLNTNTKHIGEKLWNMTEGLYKAEAIFREMHANYDEKVQAFSKAYDIDKTSLRLSAEDVSGLFDLPPMEHLRDDVLYALKETTHTLFRGPSTTDDLDRYCSDLYHEVSILKEEHYTVKTYAAAYADREEAEKILDEVHKTFPVKLDQISTLFVKARTRLEEILKKFRTETVLVRSLFLFGDELLEPIYEKGLPDLYRKMYEEGGPLEGFIVAARNFHQGRFIPQTDDAVRRAREFADSGEIDEKVRRKLLTKAEALTNKIEPYIKNHNAAT